ncbi:MAG: aminotransferase class IV [Hydrogenothermaceae bacterium]|nr:aminotransferase class IV [Hydrogenothermaceae bacterium]
MEKYFINSEEVTDLRDLRAIMYGEGVFETLRYKGRMPKRIDLHYRRLAKGLEFLKIPRPTYEDFLHSIDETAASCQEKDLYVKVVVFGEGRGFFPLQSSKYNILVVVKPYRPLNEDIKLTVSPYRVHSSDPLLRIKSTNYLRSIVVKRDAREKGCFDGIILNENEEITETSSANIYWVKGKYLYTPSLDCGVLEGISRIAVIENAKKEGFVVVEGRFGISDLKKADFVFISNSLHGIVRVSGVDL